MTADYIVALRYTAAAGAHAGIVTWTPFGSKMEFDEWFKNGGSKEQEVVEQDITQERAIELARKTPLGSYTRAAIHESTDPATGKVNSELLRSRVQEIALALSSR